MKTDTPSTLDIIHRLSALTRSHDRVGNPIRLQRALSNAAQTDGKNPALADMMELVLLSLEDCTSPETGPPPIRATMFTLGTVSVKVERPDLGAKPTSAFSVPTQARTGPRDAIDQLRWSDDLSRQSERVSGGGR